MRSRTLAFALLVALVLCTVACNSEVPTPESVGGGVISWQGSFEESPANPKKYDAYFNTADGCSYIYDGAKWALLASKGDKGDSGANGVSIVWKGTFYSHPENPQELWTYYNATDGNSYIYSNGSWNLLIENLTVNYDTPTIIGTVSPNGDSYSVSAVYVKVVDESSNTTIWNNIASVDGDFAVSGLDSKKTYTVLFSSKRQSDVNVSNSKGISSESSSTYGAVRRGVSPLKGHAQDIGDVVLSPNGVVKGSVLLGNDAASNAGVDVFLEGTSYAVKTDDEGNYTLDDVLQGSYSLLLKKDGYISQIREVLVFSSDISTFPCVDVPMVNLVKGSCTLRGTVGYADKTERTGINVVLIASNGKTVRTAMTEDDGAFSFEDVAPDDYTIRASSDGYASVDRNVSISMGESYIVTLDSLTNLCGTIYGSVSMNDSGLNRDVKVKALSKDGKRSYETVTDEYGCYTLENVFNGDYTVYFEKDGYERFTSNVTVEPGCKQKLDIEMKSLFGSIRVIVSFVDKEDSSGIVVNVYHDGVLVFSVTTTKTGIVLISNLPIGDGYSVIASSDGYGSSGEDKVSVSSGVVSSINLQKLSNRFGSIKGRVVDSKGSPVESATVSLSSDDGNSYTLTTKQDGSFSKTDVSVGVYSVSANKAGFLATELPSKYVVESAKATEVLDDIVLISRYADISGSVSYDHGGDASDISVTIEDNEGRPIGTVVTNETGSYSFKVESGSYFVRANSSDFFESAKAISVVAGGSYTLKLDGLKSKYGSVSGKVLDSKSSSIEGATIRLDQANGTSYTLTSGSDGSFSSDRVLVGDYSVTILKKDFQTLVLPLKYMVESSKRTAIGDVVLTSEYAGISGKVGYADKANPSGILVTIENSDGTTLDSFDVGSDGSFVFRVAAGTFVVKAKAVGYSEVSKTITVVSGNNYSIDLGTISTVYGAIDGEVVDTDGNAMPGVIVNLTGMDGKGDAITLSTGADGRFSSSTIPIGTYTITISKSGYVDIVCNDVPIVGGKQYSIGRRTLVSGTAGITGRIMLEGQSNYSGVTVSATSINDSSKVYTTTTTDEGLYYFLSIESGAYFIKAQKDGYLTDNTQQVSISAGSISEVKNITLRSENSTVTGSVSLEGSSSFVGVNVLLKSSDTEISFSTTTDSNGRYIFNNVKSGNYELILSKEGYANASIKDLYVEKGIEKSIDAISMNIAYASIRGQVELELRTEFSGALVTATNISDSNIIYSAITNSEGVFTFARMYTGEYSIVVSCTGYSSITLPTAKVVDDTTVDVGKANLKIARGDIVGIVRLEGYTDHSGIKVSMLGTDYEATTKADGSYSFSVPSGNYPGGLRFEYGDFETTSYATTIPVLTNSTYAVPDVEMKCLRVPKVYGRVSISGLTKAEYDGVEVRIVELPQFVFTTDKDGSYVFEHVPVGTYTLEFTRENARKVTKIVAVEPSPTVRIEDIVLIPDAVTLYGYVSLDRVDDYSGVTVRITTPGSVELSTVTDAAGYWYIGNVVASKEHEVVFEKAGWVSQSFHVEADKYKPMAFVDYNDEVGGVVLNDTTSPVISRISANIGRSTDKGREVNIYLYTDEKGSGIKWIQGSTDGSFEGVEEQAYYNPFTLYIPDEEGEYTLSVRVKDAAGNVSNTAEANIVVRDDRTELNGPLSGDKLHLTKERSPYVMTGDVLVNKGDALVIDPGVEIQVSGAYFIQVEGSVSAVGTEQDRIKVYGVDSGAGRWQGMNFIADSNSVISHADISGMAVGIYGYCDLDDVLLSAASGGYAIGSKNRSLEGDVRNSEVDGKVVQNGGTIADSRFSGSVSAKESVVFRSGFSSDATMESCMVNNSVFSGGSTTFRNSAIVNDSVESRNLKAEGCIVRLSTFTGCSMSLSGGLWMSNNLNGCSFVSYSVWRMTGSNLVSCGDITIGTKRSEVVSYDMTGNYWGDDKTVELDSKGDDANLNFIHDCYDDFNLSRVIYRGYSRSALAGCGYQGPDYGTTGGYSGYSIGDTGPARGIVFYDKGFYSDGWRYLECAPNDIGRFVFGYYRQDGGNYKFVGTSTSVGAGMYNTEALVDAMDMGGLAYKNSSGDEKAEYAARKCMDYEYGGYDDWFLPSKDELNLMYENLKRNGIGQFADDYYWSSSEYNARYAWWQYFYSGRQDGSNRSYVSYVRPIRAF